MKLKGLEFRSDPSDLISIKIDGLGVIDLYNNAKLFGYSWLFKDEMLKIRFGVDGAATEIDLYFSGIRNLEAFPDVGVLQKASNVEFIRFVLGVNFLEQDSSAEKWKNVEFSTNLVDYRFWADQLEARVIS